MIQYYIGHSTDSTIRHQASSGGIGTAIIKYLLSTNDYGTSTTFFFDKEKCAYDIKLIYSFEEYNNCGSVYQDINILSFIKSNLDKIRSGIVLCCPPCQVAGLRVILSKAKIKHFILSFCCSGQITLEGTWNYYKLLGIDKKNIDTMQYRGNGWPSGIQIKLKDGSEIFHKNYTEPWVTMKNSYLFQPQRCFYCKFDTGRNADVALADPWLPEFSDKEKMGKSLFMVFTETGLEIINRLISDEIIIANKTDYRAYATAQKPNVEKELKVRTQTLFIKRLQKLIKNEAYYRWASKSLNNMRIHIKICQVIYILSNNMKSKIKLRHYVDIFKTKIRNNRYKRKLGSYKGDFNIWPNVIVNNPKCIHLGKSVGIGSDTYLGLVVNYAGITYNPKIIIGDGTWVGKHCSIAAVDRVEIGKNVLFAGYVHITDHSHGYEDITLPVKEQRLISKGPVVIEDDCWLGFNCEILSGVRIGTHSIVAARAVVTHDVPAYSIVAGNPARIVKQYNSDTGKWEKIKIGQ